MFRPKQPPQADTGATSSSALVLSERLRKALCLMAVETWRLQRKIGRLPTDVAGDELAGIEASVSRMESGLRECGIECRDYTNALYDPGMQVRVLAFERIESGATARPTILRTISPGVYFMEQLLQPGEVVVASPDIESEGA